MSEDERKPLDDLKQGLGLLLRAAKGAASQIPTGKIEDVVKDGAKEVGRAFETLGSELDRVLHKSPFGGATPPPASHGTGDGERTGDDPKEPEAYDDAYAPDPPNSRGPRVG